MTEIYIFWAILAFYAVGSWANYLLPKFTKRTLPDWSHPLGVTVLAAYTAYFLHFFHEAVGDDFVQMYGMLMQLASAVQQMM